MLCAKRMHILQLSHTYTGGSSNRARGSTNDPRPVGAGVEWMRGGGACTALGGWGQPSPLIHWLACQYPLFDGTGERAWPCPSSLNLRTAWRQRFRFTSTNQGMRP